MLNSIQVYVEVAILIWKREWSVNHTMQVARAAQRWEKIYYYGGWMNFIGLENY